jgi:segregation and condensation protein B
MAMEAEELRAVLEAILFVSTEPVKVEDLVESFSGEGTEVVTAQLEEIKRLLEDHIGGFTLEQTGGGWRLATRAEHDPVLKKYFARKGENRLSIAALETLAITAYRQPITAPEISEIRGVNSTGVLRTLMERRMIRVAGRKNVVGSPFLYRTTKDFLIHFGLNDIRDLPALEEFGDLIGEAMNEDLMAAIAAAPEGSAVDMQEISEVESVRVAGEALAQLEAAELPEGAHQRGARFDEDAQPEAEAVDDASGPADDESAALDEPAASNVQVEGAGDERAVADATESDEASGETSRHDAGDATSSANQADGEVESSRSDQRE